MSGPTGPRTEGVKHEVEKSYRAISCDNADAAIDRLRQLFRIGFDLIPEEEAAAWEEAGEVDAPAPAPAYDDMQQIVEVDDQVVLSDFKPRFIIERVSQAGNQSRLGVLLAEHFGGVRLPRNVVDEFRHHGVMVEISKYPFVEQRAAVKRKKLP